MSLGPLLLAGALALGGESPPPPPLRAHEQVADLGPLLQGESAGRVFRLENVGPDPVPVHDVRAKCGCTVTRVFDAAGHPVDLSGVRTAQSPPLLELAPGEAFAVEVELDTRSLPLGTVAKSVSVRAGPRDAPPLRLEVRADVRPLVAVEPRPLAFGSVTQGDERRAVARLVPAPGIELRALAVEGHDAVFAGRLLPSEEAGDASTIAVEVTLRGDAPLGNHAGHVTVRTDHPRVPEVQIPVSANVRAVVRVDTGNALDRDLLPLGALPRGSVTDHVVEIRNDDPRVPWLPGEPSVEGKLVGLVEARLEAVEVGVLYRLHLSVRAPGERAFFRGVVRVPAEHARVREVVVQVNGLVR